MSFQKQKSYKSNLLRQKILQRIYSGELKEKQRLESCRDLCKTYNLSYVTVNKVIKELCVDGVLKTIPGSGTIVKSTAPLENNAPRRILLYDVVVTEATWNSLVTAEPVLKDVFFPRFVGHYNDLLDKEKLSNQPDFIYTSDELIETMAHRDMLYPLDDVVKDFAIDLNRYPDKLLAPFRVNGKLYALPICFSTFSLFYNKDMFDAAGLDYPDESWTWKELAAASKKLTSTKRNKVNHFGFAPFVDVSNINNFYLQGIPESVDPESYFLNTNCTSGLDFLLKLIHDDEVAPSPQDSESFVTDLFMSGKVAMTSCKYKMVQLLKDANFRWGVTILPIGKSRCSSCSMQGIALNKHIIPTASHIEQLRILTGEKMQELLLKNFGHLPVFADLAESAPYSKPFIKQLDYSKNIYLNSAENYNLIKNLIFQMFIKVISPEELLNEFRNILIKEKYNNVPFKNQI